MLLENVMMVPGLYHLLPTINSVSEVLINCNCYQWEIEEYVPVIQNQTSHFCMTTCTVDTPDSVDTSENRISIKIKIQLDDKIVDLIKEGGK